MVLDFTYYESGLPGALFLAKEAAKLGCAQLLANLIATLVILHGKPEVGAMTVLFGGLLGLLWAFRVCCMRPGGRKRLLSLPGGPAFAALSSRLGPELRTVWLGEDADCHPTHVAHSFDVSQCPLSRDKDCWQCLYILQVELTLGEGHTPVAATTNLFNDCCMGSAGWEDKYGHGSSELPSERDDLDAELPDDWGTGDFDESFTGVVGCCREAPVHPKTHEPLGVGCRWERQFLDSLDEDVLVVAKPPSTWALIDNLQMAGLVTTLGLVGSMSAMLPVVLVLHMLRPGDFAPAFTGVILYTCSVALLVFVLTTVVFKEGRARLCGQMEPLVHHPKYLSRGGALSPGSCLSPVSLDDSDEDESDDDCNTLLGRLGFPNPLELLQQLWDQPPEQQQPLPHFQQHVVLPPQPHLQQVQVVPHLPHT